MGGRGAGALAVWVVACGLSGGARGEEFVEPQRLRVVPPEGWTRAPLTGEEVAQIGALGANRPMAVFEAPDGCGRLVLVEMRNAVADARQAIAEFTPGSSAGPMRVVRSEVVIHGGQEMARVEVTLDEPTPAREILVMLPHPVQAKLAVYALAPDCVERFASAVDSSIASFRQMDPRDPADTAPTIARKTVWQEVRSYVSLAAILLLVMVIHGLVRKRRR